MPFAHGVARARETARGRETGAALFWLVAALALSFALHWPFLDLPMISDEGGYAYVAQRWLDGRGELYHDIWVSRPQGIFVAYGLIFETIGTSTQAIRLGAWLVSAATLVVVWAYARAWAGPRAASLAAILFAILSGSPAIEGFTANAEVFMALPAALAALLLLRAGRAGWPAPTLVAVGLLGGAATLLKPSGVVMLPVAVGFIWFTGTGGRAMAVRRSAWVALGSALAAAPALIHGYLIGWDEFIFASATYRLTFQSSATVPVEQHLRALIELWDRIWPAVVLVAAVLGLRWHLSGGRLDPGGWTDRYAQAGRTGLVAWGGSRPAVGRPAADGDVLVRLWLLGCLVGIAMGGDWWSHYLVQIVGPFAIWFAPLLLDLAGRLARPGRLALAVAVAVVFLLPYGVLTRGSADAMSLAIFNHSGYPMQDEVAAYLREHSKPETPIFVAFDQAALYYLADRPATYRYMYDQELRAVPTAYDDLLAMIRSPLRPAFVVGTLQGAPFPDRGQAFWDEVADRYHLIAMVRGVPIYRVSEFTRLPALPEAG